MHGSVVYIAEEAALAVALFARFVVGAHFGEVCGCFRVTVVAEEVVLCALGAGTLPQGRARQTLDAGQRGGQRQEHHDDQDRDLVDLPVHEYKAAE